MGKSRGSPRGITFLIGCLRSHPPHKMADVRRLSPSEVQVLLPEVAALRIDVFRAWPYLYDGDLAYEKKYLKPYADDPDTVIIGAFDGTRLVGAATGMPILKHDDGFGSAFAHSDLDLSSVFYCAESVLLPAYRGLGIGHVFFDERERAARHMGYSYSAFCAVERAHDHPARPADYRPLDPFWRSRGYQPLEGVRAVFDWKDLGDDVQTPKHLQFWGTHLI